MANLIVGYCASATFDVVEPFIASFYQNISDAALCLFVSGMDDRFCREAERIGIYIENPEPFLLDGFHVKNSVFFMYREFLKNEGHRFKDVLLTDVSDVIFQSDPFLVMRDKSVSFAAEHATIRSDPWNSKWLIELYGAAIFNEIADNIISCTGTTMGSVQGVSAYVDYMCFALEAGGFNKEINYSQGIHNYIVWKVRPEFGSIDLKDRLVSTVGLTNSSRIRILEERIFLDEVAAPVIHQWDRQPAIVEFIQTSQKFKMLGDGKKGTLAPNMDAIQDSADAQQSPSKLMELDRIRYFSEVFRADVSLGELLRFYISFHGPIFNDQKEHLLKRLKLLLMRLGIGRTAESLIREDGRVEEGFLAEFFPQIATSYYEDVDEHAFRQTVILPACKNELYDESFPKPINPRLGQRERAAFSAYRSDSAKDFFVGPHQYQLFDAARGVQFSAASLRSYSKDVLNYDRAEIPGLVVLAQDHGDGSNFAHFTFDWLTRIMHVIESRQVDPKRCTFIMGGNKGIFQKLLVAALERIYKLDSGQFYFPNRRRLFRISGEFIFFSDQKIGPMHPAQMAHPESIKLLRKLTGEISCKACNIDRVFISRADARTRNIGNEAEIIEIAERYGFKVFRLSEMRIEEQISLMRGARYVVGAHGMGLAHIIFNRGPLSLLELFHPTIATDAYALIARGFGFKHDFVVGTDLDDGKGSYSIAPKEFAKKLEEFLADG